MFMSIPPPARRHSTAGCRLPCRLRRAPASARRILAAPLGRQAAALLLPVGGAAQHRTAQLVQLPQQRGKALLVAPRTLSAAPAPGRYPPAPHSRTAFLPCPAPPLSAGRSSFQCCADMSLIQKGQLPGHSGRQPFGAQVGGTVRHRHRRDRIGRTPAANGRQHHRCAGCRQQKQHPLGRLLNDLEQRIGRRYCVPFRFSHRR